MRCSLLCLLAFGASPLFAQSFNVDLGQQGMVPGGGHRGAANQSGPWQLVISGASHALNTVQAQSTGVTLSAQGAGPERFENIYLTGHRAWLLEDGLTIPGASADWRFEGLETATYELTTYGWVAANPPTADRVRVSVVNSLDPPQTIGETFQCYELGKSHAVHRVHVTTGQLRVHVERLGALGVVNGFQLRRLATPTDPLLVGLLPGTPPGLPTQCYMFDVALRGGTAVLSTGFIGIPGTIYVYGDGAGGWAFEQELISSSTGNWGYDLLFARLALDGSTVIVGLPFRDLTFGGGADEPGGAVVFERQFGSWSETAFLLPANNAPGDRFGSGVSVQGDRAVIGAYRNGGGSAYVYDKTPHGWVESAELLPDVPQSSSFFGYSTALLGETAFVGAPNYSGPAGFQSGAVFVFRRGPQGWTQVDRWDSEAAQEYLGRALSADGERVAVGAYNPSSSQLGFLEIWRAAGPGYVREDRFRATDTRPFDGFGAQLSLSANRLLVGAGGWSTECTEEGAAYLFERQGTSWAEANRIRSPLVGEPDTFGANVALDGEQGLVVGRCSQGQRAIWEIRAVSRLGTRSCNPGVPNSTLLPATLEVTGSSLAALGEVHLTALELPPNEFGLFLASRDAGFVIAPGGSAGILCLSGSIARFIPALHTGPAGRFDLQVNTSALPTTPAQPILAGEHWHFQAWYRDSSGSNFSDMLSVTFH